MSTVKVTSRFKILEVLDRFVDNALANDLGRTIVKESLQNISEGQSPVSGHGRFERYKNRQSYPGKLKAHRPVNLNLTGEMLGGYGYRIRSDHVIEVGMVSGSQQRKEVATYHNTGTDKMAMRRFIPQRDEQFTVRIMRKIRDLYGKRLEKLIRQSNKKS